MYIIRISLLDNETINIVVTDIKGDDVARIIKMKVEKQGWFGREYPAVVKRCLTSVDQCKFI